jgi:CheY-like chemotaxis protein
VNFAADGETVTPGADRSERPKLLIVDDDSEVRFIVAEFLESSGYNVVQANGGREALDLLPRHPDLRMIISDIRMPGMSGIELVDIATRHQRDLKVILISGYFIAQQIGRRFLSKPFRMRELEAAVRAELSD